MEKFNKEELKKYFLTDNKSGYKTKESHINKNFNGLLEAINNFIENSEFSLDIPFTQKLYNYLYNITKKQKCETCGKDIIWRNRFTEGYLVNCSKKCRNKSENRIKKIKETTLKKYGVDSISKLDEVKNKKNNTNLKKYGTKIFLKSKIFKEKTKETNLKKYGYEHPIKSDIVKNKRKDNNLKKYGVDSPSKIDIVKEKIKETNLKKYGVESVMQLDEVKNKNIESRTFDTIKRYKEKLGDDVEIKYINGKIRVRNQCDIHSEYFIDKTLFYYRVLVHNIKNPCIHCNPVNENKSIKESEINNYLKNELLIDVEKIRIGSSEIDIFSEKNSLGIEFNGLYWHSEIFKNKNYHLEKTNYFKDKNINIIHIFEDEWVHKNSIVKSFLKNKFGLINNKIYARKCQIKEINNNDCEKFLFENHLQGNKKSKIRLGLFYDEELVSVMTFSKEYRKGSKNKDYELDRFCNKLNTSIIGGASKLFNHFIKQYNPTKIITFADKRYSNGDLYFKLGFKHKYDSPPNYWYFKRADGIRYHRFNFRKSNLIKEGYDSSKTEHEIMLERGFMRIYDCGNMKFEMEF